MAKKTGAKKVVVTKPRKGKPVRLDMVAEDYERLERCARHRGLNLASYARMAVLALIRRDEDEMEGR
jgi:hypothetical protein